MNDLEVVVVKNLTKRYGDLTAVDNISFSIRRGEIFGLLGPNGAGKTTTINMMIGLARPTAGSVLIKGIDVVKSPKQVQAIIGIVPDESNLYGEMDGFENLCFCGALYGMSKAARERRARELLEQFHLAKAGKRPFRAYSKGMKRRLTIAAGIIHQPEILFLDEPTTGIDVESARQIRQLLLDLKEKGTTVLITTHYIEEAERVCDRIAFMVNGRIAAKGTVSELMDSITPGHTTRLTADRDLTPFVKELAQRFAICTVELQENNGLALTSKERIPLSPILQYLDGLGVSIFEARELRPTLEDVFVKITGIEATVLDTEKEKGGLGK